MIEPPLGSNGKFYSKFTELTDSQGFLSNRHLCQERSFTILNKLKFVNRLCIKEEHLFNFKPDPN